MRLALAQLLLFGMLSLPWVVERGQRTMHTVMAHGRKLLLHSPYVLPTNATEIERLDGQHDLEKHLFGTNVLAPITQPHTIIDIGCGTGRWCREVAQQFPQAQVVGIDYNLERVKATGAKLAPAARPANVSWREVNALEPLPFVDSTVDYVHMRFAATWLPRLSWLPVLSELQRILRPGGYLELMEGCMPESASAAYTALGKRMTQLLHDRGLSALLPLHLVDLLETGGFVEVGQREASVGATPEEQHLLFETTRQGFAALLPLLSKTLPQEDYIAYQAALAEIEREQPHVTRHNRVGAQTTVVKRSL